MAGVAADGDAGEQHETDRDQERHGDDLQEARRSNPDVVDRRNEYGAGDPDESPRRVHAVAGHRTQQAGLHVGGEVEHGLRERDRLERDDGDVTEGDRLRRDECRA
jgi:hypothetical protein